MVKGQGLARLLAEFNSKEFGVNFMSTNSINQQSDIPSSSFQISSKLAECSWYTDIIYFLQNLQPPTGLEKTKARYLKLKAVRYCIVDQILYWKHPSEILLRCLDLEEAKQIMTELHGSLCEGHHFWRTIAYKILRARYLWPNLFTDVCAKITTCDKCHKFLGKQQLKSFPLKPIVVFGPF